MLLFNKIIRLIGCVQWMLILQSTVGAADPFQANIPDSTVQRLEAGKQKRGAGEIDQAVTDFRQIVAANPDYYRAQYNLGLALADQAGKDRKKLAEAISALEKAREIMEKGSLKDYSIYNSLGWYYARANRSIDAEKAYKVAIAHADTNSVDTNRRLFTNLGIFYLERGDLDHARQYLQIATDKYQSESARKFLEINETVSKKTELPDGLTYQAKLSDQDKVNSQGVKFADGIRKQSGADAAVMEVLLQDRANYYHYNKRDKEDQPSPGLESTTTNRVEFEKRKLQFDGIAADRCLDEQPVVKITLTKGSIAVSPVGQ
jgi:Tfp pilus assembly protein PilF